MVARATRVARTAAAGLLVAGLGAAAGIALPVTTSGCTTHQCDTSFADFTGGEWVDADTWESSDWNGVWIPYPGMVTIRVHFPDGNTRMPDSIQGYVGTGPSPNGDVPNGYQPGDIFTEMSGQLGTLTFVDPTGFNVSNGTCASYYARFVVHFPSAPVEDGGTAGDP
jgi:hypothetical protein